MSKRFRKLLYGSSLVAALAAIAAGVMITPWFQRFLERRVVGSLEDITGGRVEIGRFSFRPLILQIVLRGLVIRGTELRADAPLFSARSAVVQLNPGTLLRRRLILHSLDLDHAEISIRTNADGSTNAPGPRLSPRQGAILEELVDLSVHRVTLAHSSISWNDKRLALEVGANDLAMLLGPERQHQYSGSLSSSALTIKEERQSLPAIAFTARFTFSRSNLEVTSLDWVSAGLRGRCSLNLRLGPTAEGHLSYKAGGDLSQFARMLRLRTVFSGQLSTEGEASIQGGQLSGQGRVQARLDIPQAGPLRPGRIDLSAVYFADPYHLEFSNLTVSALGGSVQGTARISFQTPSARFGVNVQIRDLDLVTGLASFFDLRTAHGHLRPDARVFGRVSAVWTGPFEDFNSDFDLRFQPRASGHLHTLPVTGPIRGSVSWAQYPSLELRVAEISTPHSVISARGSLGAPPSSLALNIRTSDFEEWKPLFESLAEIEEHIPLRLTSFATFRGSVFGSISHPEIRGGLQLGPFEYREWGWDSFAAGVFATRGALEISSGRLQRGNSALIVDASATLDNWKLARDMPLRISSRADHTPVDGVLAVLGVSFPAKGLAAGSLDLEGSATHLSGTGTLRVEQGSIAGEPFDSLVANLAVAQSVWDFNAIQLAKGGGQIIGQAHYDYSQQSFSVELRGIDLALDAVKRLRLCGADPSANCQLQGLASFEVHGEGTFPDVQLQLNGNVRDLRLSDTSIGSLHGQLNWRGREMEFEGRVEGAAGELRVHGRGQPGGDWPLDLSGRYTSLRVDPWIRAILDSNFSPSVTASGSFNIRGPLKNPNRLEVRSPVQDLEVHFPGLIWKNDQPVILRYADRVLSAQRFRMRGPSTDLAVEGLVRFRESPMLAITAEGNSEATLLSLLDNSLRATGRSEIKMRVSGKPSRPLLFGAINVHDVSLGYGDLPFRLTGLNGELRLEGQRAIADSLRGMVGGGTVALSGFFTLGGTPRYEARAALDKLRVGYPAGFTSLLDGNLVLVGSAERGQLGGEVTLRQLFVSENVSLMNFLFPTTAGVAGEWPSGITSPLASKIRLNVQVRSAPAVRVETHDMRLIADVDLRLEGTLANPVELGTIHFLSGEAVFRGNRYKFVRGEVSMANPFRTQPMLDVELQTRIQRYDLILSISGTLDSPKIAYRSDPPLPTADILRLLALGYSGQQGEMSTAAGQGMQTVGASALLSEALASQMTGRIQRLFGVSRIKIDPNISGAGATGGARVTVEQQVTRDFTLTYVTNTGSSQQRVIQFEWALGDTTSLVGMREQNGIFGLELKFHQRFK